MSDTSVAAIVMREGRVLVARRVFGGPLGGLWEFPGGKLEEGENEASALVREFEEEFGARLAAVRSLGETTFLHNGRNRRLEAWLAELPESEMLQLREHQACDWVDWSTLQSLDLADSDHKLLPIIAGLF